MILFTFLIGLFIGSFLGVLIDRIPKNKGFLTGRSVCDSCKKELGFLDLIPILSFIISHGKCRYCKANLSPFYPIIELTTGVLFLITAYMFNLQFIIYNFQFLLNLSYYLFIISVLIVVFFMDLKYRIIADKIIIFSVIVVFSYLIFFNQANLIIHLLSALGAFGFFIAIPLLYYFFTKKIAMGGGDIKFSFLMGLILGFPNIIVALYIAFLTGAAYSIILIIWKKKDFRKETVAFGPFLVLGAFIALLWGNLIWEKVANYFII